MTDRVGREWLVIEASTKHSIFASPEAQKPRGYIPRDAAETILGRSMVGVQWFTQAESEAMRRHPEWRTEAP
jgi:hypothetical protein